MSRESTTMANFVVILATMVAFWHRGCTGASEREGKFLGFGGDDDLFNDLFEDISDPLSLPRSSYSVRTRILQKLRQEKDKRKQDAVPPIPIPEQLVQKLAEPSIVPASTVLVNRPAVGQPIVSQQKPDNAEAPIVPASTILINRPAVGQPIISQRKPENPEPLVLYDTSTSKFEVLPAGFASPATPVTESMFMFGGQFGQSRPANGSDQKVFWSSVGDFLETVPFLPIEVNVPDLIQAMASAVLQRIPLANRLGNPNEPRPHIKMPDSGANQHTNADVKMEAMEPTYYADLPINNNLLEYRQMGKTKPQKNKRKKPSRRKVTKRSTTEAYKMHGNYGPAENKQKIQNKAWINVPTESVVIHRNDGPAKNEQKIQNKAWLNVPTESAVIHKNNSPVKNKQKTQNKAWLNIPTESVVIHRNDGPAKNKQKTQNKAWFNVPTESAVLKTTARLKFFNRDKTSANEQVKYKNMPFTRQHTRYADKELFNFKHSDISNSPIMILNMPNRPVVMYKVKNEQKSEIPGYERHRPELPQELPQYEV